MTFYLPLLFSFSINLFVYLYYCVHISKQKQHRLNLYY